MGLDRGGADYGVDDGEYYVGYREDDSSVPVDDSILQSQLEQLRTAKSELMELSEMAKSRRASERGGDFPAMSPVGMLTVAEVDRETRNLEVHAEGGILVMDKSTRETGDDGEVVNDWS